MVDDHTGLADTLDGAPPAAADLRLVLVTGRAGAGRTTAIAALQDIGFETVDTPPLDFVPAMARRLAEDGRRRLAIGVDARAGGLTPPAFAAMLARLRRIAGAGATVLFLDCDDDALRRRYTATRRRHPLAPEDGVEEGLRRDRERMPPLRDSADLVIDTTEMTPRELKRVVQQRFGGERAAEPVLSLVSFSYRHGLPPEADMVFDCRFLSNPYYVEALRSGDGRDPAVAAHVARDPRFDEFLARLTDLSALLLPAFAAEGKSYLTLAFGCTGGRHRSVAVAEAMARSLGALGWRSRLRHREIAAQEETDQNASDRIAADQGAAGLDADGGDGAS